MFILQFPNMFPVYYKNQNLNNLTSNINSILASSESKICMSRNLPFYYTFSYFIKCNIIYNSKVWNVVYRVLDGSVRPQDIINLLQCPAHYILGADPVCHLSYASALCKITGRPLGGDHHNRGPYVHRRNIGTQNQRRTWKRVLSIDICGHIVRVPHRTIRFLQKFGNHCWNCSYIFPHNVITDA